MSGSMEALTAALEANTAIQTKVLVALQKGAGGATAAAGKPAAAAASKPAGKPAGKKKTTVEDVAAAFSGYLGIKDKDEREVRKANVKAIVDYFGAAKATEIAEESFDEALGYLQQYIDGETPEFAGGGEDGDEDGALV